MLILILILVLPYYYYYYYHEVIRLVSDVATAVEEQPESLPPKKATSV